MSEGEKTIIKTGEEGTGCEQLPPDIYMSIEVLEGPDKGMSAALTKTRTILGRSPETDIRFRDPTVSSVHAFLDFINGEVFITDQKSSNGTFVDGQKVTRAPVNNMSEIRLGNTRLLFSLVRDVYGTYLPPTATSVVLPNAPAVDPLALTDPRREIPNPDLPPATRVVLYIVEGPDAGRKFLLRKQSAVIGRSPACDIQLNDSAVSRRHCQIMINPQFHIGIKDLASKNGTLVNGRIINATRINPDDLIQIGDTSFKLLLMQ